MPWLKLIHIGAVIVWCGVLLYLPLAIAAARDGEVALAERSGRLRVLRGLFTSLATPAALLAIGSGTAIFVMHGLMASWLIAKAAAVGLLVLGHAACGLLIRRTEQQDPALAGEPCRACAVISLASLLWLAGIAWLVLGKPSF